MGRVAILDGTNLRSVGSGKAQKGQEEPVRSMGGVGTGTSMQHRRHGDLGEKECKPHAFIEPTHEPPDPFMQISEIKPSSTPQGSIRWLLI